MHLNKRGIYNLLDRVCRIPNRTGNGDHYTKQDQSNKVASMTVLLLRLRLRLILWRIMVLSTPALTPNVLLSRGRLRLCQGRFFWVSAGIKAIGVSPEYFSAGAPIFTGRAGMPNPPLRMRLGQGKYLCLVKSYAHGWRFRLLQVEQLVGMKNRPKWKVGEYWFDI